MNVSRNVALTAEEELVDVLLDFIVVAATLAKKLSHAKSMSNYEGGKVNEQSQRTGYGHQRPANRSFSN